MGGGRGVSEGEGEKLEDWGEKVMACGALIANLIERCGVILFCIK